MHFYLEFTLVLIDMALVTALLYRLLTNPEKMRALKSQTNELKDKSSKAQKSGDTKESQRLMVEMLKANQQMMQSNMKPLMASLLFFVLIIGLLTGKYSGVVMALPFYVPFLGTSISWFVWYVVVGFAFNIFFRKMLGLE